MPFNRRARLLCLTVLLVFLFYPSPSQASDWRHGMLQQDRCLDLYRPQTKETAQFCYWRHLKGIDVAGYQKANWILRDASYKKQVVMDRQLLDALFLIQQWLKREGRPHKIHILSGYRTPEHNRKLAGAASKSLHMEGKAIDLYIPGIKPELLAAMSRIIGTGGVGIYARRNFVHVDTGRVRVWNQ